MGSFHGTSGLNEPELIQELVIGCFGHEAEGASCIKQNFGAVIERQKIYSLKGNGPMSTGNDRHPIQVV